MLLTVATLENVSVPELAEAKAVSYALACAFADDGYHKIIIASDCANLVNKLKAWEEDRSASGAVVHDIRVLASKFVTISFVYVNRVCNRADHVLA